MEKNKITQKEYFNALAKVVKGEPVEIPAEELVAFIDSRVALLNKKSTTKKSAKDTEENIALRNEVARVLTNEGATATEISKKSDMLKDLSTSKMSALLKVLVEEGRVFKYTDGKKSLFKLPATDDTTEE